MTAFTNITIIYNPNSTGPGRTMARKLQSQLRLSMSDIPIKLEATKHVGHGEKLAYKLAKTNARPLIISASGDGGYSDVINGLMRAQTEGAHPTAGLLPAGNANDHYTDIHHGDLVHNILNHHIQRIDLLKLTASVHHKRFERYAHSYVGLGLTPHVGVQLNRVKLNWWREKLVILRSLFTATPVRITVRGKRRSYENLVFSNVSKMSKFLVLSNSSSVNDGKFEVTALPRLSKWRLVPSLIKSSVGILDEPLRTMRYTFYTRHKTEVQVDGEVFTLDARTEVTVSVRSHTLHCIV